MLKSITMEVVGEQRLHCEGCENRVMRLLKGVQGVARVRAQAGNQRIDVQYDPAAVDEAALTDRLTRAGYETRPVTPTQTQKT